MKVLITGAAGFIGSALAVRPLERDESVTGLFVEWYREYYNVKVSA